MMNDDEKNKKNMQDLFIFKNSTIIILFVFNIVLLFVSATQPLIQSIPEYGGSGWFYVIIPMVALMQIIPYVIPPISGIILESINIKKKNKILTFLVFVCSLVSLFIFLNALEIGDNIYVDVGHGNFENLFTIQISDIILYIYVIETVILSLITMVKSIFEIKDRTTNKEN